MIILLDGTGDLENRVAAERLLRMMAPGHQGAR
jgi:hypothetical protein